MVSRARPRCLCRRGDCRRWRGALWRGHNLPEKTYVKMIIPYSLLQNRQSKKGVLSFRFLFVSVSKAFFPFLFLLLFSFGKKPKGNPRDRQENPKDGDGNDHLPPLPSCPPKTSKSEITSPSIKSSNYINPSPPLPHHHPIRQQPHITKRPA